MVADAELRSALERAAPLLAPETRPARLVRSLALRGAEALLAEQTRREEAASRIAEWTLSGEPPWDPDVLERVDELAWGRPPAS